MRLTLSKKKKKKILKPTTSTRILSSGQWVSGSTCWAKLSLPSSSFPMIHCTNPPYILLHALPEPCRAIPDSSPSTPNAWARVYTERKRPTEKHQKDSDSVWTPCLSTITLNTHLSRRILQLKRPDLQLWGSCWPSRCGLFETSRSNSDQRLHHCVSCVPVYELNTEELCPLYFLIKKAVVFIFPALKNRVNSLSLRQDCSLGWLISSSLPLSHSRSSRNDLLVATVVVVLSLKVVRKLDFINNS